MQFAVQSISVFAGTSINKNHKITKKRDFLSCLVRIETIQENSYPTPPNTSLSHPSLFFGGRDLEESIGEPPEIYEDPITEEEQENIPLETMAEHRNGIGDEERI